MCIQVSHGWVSGSLSVSCALGDVPFKSRKKSYVFLIQCVGVHILVYFDERMLWMLEICVLNCRMMEEGIKDRHWTEAFASMWAALEAAIFVLVANWTLINTGIIMMRVFLATCRFFPLWLNWAFVHDAHMEIYVHDQEKTGWRMACGISFPSNLLYYGNSDAIANGSNIESTGPQSTAYIFLSSLGLRNELWEESR